MYNQNQPSLWSLFGIVAFVIVAAGYGMISLSTEDPLWFVPGFEEHASEITLYCFGSTLHIGPDSPHLSPLNSLLNEALSGRKNWDSLTMSDATYAYYQSSDAIIALEFHYASPVRVHSIYKYFSGVDAIVVPLVGRHANLNAVFGRNDGTNTAGALHVASTAGLLTYLDDSGLCSP